MLFRQIEDPHLAQYAYLIGCQQTKEALVIDPERDVDRYLQIAEDAGLRLTAVAAAYLAREGYDVRYVSDDSAD